MKIIAIEKMNCSNVKKNCELQIKNQQNKLSPIKTTPPPRTVGLECKFLSFGISINFVCFANKANNLVKIAETNIKNTLSIIFILIPFYRLF